MKKNGKNGASVPDVKPKSLEIAEVGIATAHGRSVGWSDHAFCWQRDMQRCRQTQQRWGTQQGEGGKRDLQLTTGK